MLNLIVTTERGWLNQTLTDKSSYQQYSVPDDYLKSPFLQRCWSGQHQAILLEASEDFPVQLLLLDSNNDFLDLAGAADYYEMWPVASFVAMLANPRFTSASSWPVVVNLPMTTPSHIIDYAFKLEADNFWSQCNYRRGGLEALKECLSTNVTKKELMYLPTSFVYGYLHPLILSVQANYCWSLVKSKTDIRKLLYLHHELSIPANNTILEIASTYSDLSCYPYIHDLTSGHRTTYRFTNRQFNNFLSRSPLSLPLGQPAAVGQLTIIPPAANPADDQSVVKQITARRLLASGLNIYSSSLLNECLLKRQPGQTGQRDPATNCIYLQLADAKNLADSYKTVTTVVAIPTASSDGDTTTSAVSSCYEVKCYEVKCYPASLVAYNNTALAEQLYTSGIKLRQTPVVTVSATDLIYHTTGVRPVADMLAVFPNFTDSMMDSQGFEADKLVDLFTVNETVVLDKLTGRSNTNYQEWWKRASNNEKQRLMDVVKSHFQALPLPAAISYPFGIKDIKNVFPIRQTSLPQYIVVQAHDTAAAFVTELVNTAGDIAGDETIAIFATSYGQDNRTAGDEETEDMIISMGSQLRTYQFVVVLIEGEVSQLPVETCLQAVDTIDYLGQAVNIDSVEVAYLVSDDSDEDNISVEPLMPIRYLKYIM